MGGSLISVRAGLAQETDFPALVKCFQTEKPTFTERQRQLLAERYDLADRPAQGVAMSRGKSVQEGVRVRLPQGMTREKLAELSPGKIRENDLWPAGFFPLPHPHHEADGMMFPKVQIDEVNQHNARDLTRFDLDYDLPQHLKSVAHGRAIEIHLKCRRPRRS